GTTTVTVIVTDAAGNATTKSFKVNVVDTIAPFLTLPPDQTFAATSATGAFVTFLEATATDAVSAVVIGYSPANGSFFTIGTTTVLVTATDSARNASTGSFRVTVRSEGDTTPPVLTLPADQTFEATSPAGAVVHYTGASATDESTPVTIVYSRANDTVFPLGTTP